MVQTIHPVTGRPDRVFERAPGSVEIRELHPQEVAIVRVDDTLEALPEAIGEAIAEVAARMAEAGVEIAGPPFTRYLSFDPARVVAEVGCPVLRPAPHVGDAYPGRLSGGRVASVVHLGPYDTIAGTYTQLERWLAETGTRATGPMWEVYWSDPGTDPDPVGWRTEILMPIA